ncbi:MAG: hypothetical protein JXA73_15485 [Acidobacteria bacterium]|nr:hypothetical protein [Acidobacteriota bacterium]
MIIKPFNKSQLQGIRDGLKRDLNVVLEANASSKKKLDKLSSPEYLKKYTPDALAGMRREAVEEEARKVLDIIKTLPDTRSMVERQRQYWTEDFWRDARLNPEPPAVRVNNDSYLTSAEKAVQALADFTTAVNASLLEVNSKLWLTREMELMDAEGFTRLDNNASESGNAQILYLARLVFRNRTFNSEAEKGRVSAALFTAEKDLWLPVRSESLDTLQACTELMEDIQSAWLALSKGEEDIRSKVRPYAEERKAREAAEKTAAEAEKRELEAMEDNLLIRGHA